MKKRMLLTLDAIDTSEVQYQRNWGVVKLATVILETKGVEVTQDELDEFEARERAEYEEKKKARG